MHDYAVLDLETTIHNTGAEAVGKNKADPFSPKNRMVFAGFKYHNSSTLILRTFDLTNLCTEIVHNTRLLVGQNIKFDLHYLMHNSIGRDILDTTEIWDTQLAEYLLTGQTTKYASLDKLAIKYGGTVKDNKIKEYWDNGVSTEDIPENEILPYLIDDVKNTELVFHAQMKRAKSLGMLNLLRTQMRALKATIEMEFNGMHFDKVKSLHLRVSLQLKLTACKEEIEYLMTSRFANANIKPNALSNKQLSAVLFGGDLKYLEDVPILDGEGNPVKFKTGIRKGQVKTRKINKLKTISGPLNPRNFGTKASKYGVYAIGDDVLKKVVSSTTTAPTTVDFCTKVLHLRELNKEVNTYLAPYAKLTHADGCIHGKLSHVGTATGRLSSTSPNLQNITTATEE